VFSVTVIGLARQVTIFATICHKELLKLGKTCSLVILRQKPTKPVFMGVHRVFACKSKWQRARDSKESASF
jgi:hypothetical protein